MKEKLKLGVHYFAQLGLNGVVVGILFGAIPSRTFALWDAATYLMVQSLWIAAWWAPVVIGVLVLHDDVPPKKIRNSWRTLGLVWGLILIGETWFGPKTFIFTVSVIGTVVVVTIVCSALKGFAALAFNALAQHKSDLDDDADTAETSPTQP
ncbi:MAG: hypothetical protein ACE5K1_04200 [Acidiferrobacterales bacterium]